MTQAQTSAKPSGYRWVVFSLLAFGYLLVYFHRLCPAVVALDMQADLNTSGALLGFLYYKFFGCNSGCVISSNPLISTAYGAVAGFFIAFF